MLFVLSMIILMIFEEILTSVLEMLVGQAGGSYTLLSLKKMLLLVLGCSCGCKEILFMAKCTRRDWKRKLILFAFLFSLHIFHLFLITNISELQLAWLPIFSILIYTYLQCFLPKMVSEPLTILSV